MKRILIGAWLLILAGTGLVGCKSLEPPMPAENYKYEEVKPLTSTLSLFADLDIAGLEEVINRSADSLLYEDNSFVDNDHDNLMLKALKNGKMKFSLNGDLLTWEIPLRVEIKKTAFFVAFNRPFGDIMEAKGELILRFRTNFNVGNNWIIKTTTASEGYEWTKKPTVKVAGLTIPVTTVANLLLKSNLESYSGKIDETIARSFNLKNYADKGWQMLFEPFKIPGDYNAWVTMTPHTVSLLPMTGSNGKLRFGAMVTSEIECTLDKQPPVRTATPLPDLRPLAARKDTFRINLLTEIPYNSIERIAMEELKDSVYHFGSKRLTFETLRVFGSNGKLAIETKVKGSLKGTIYLTGTPYFYALDSTLRVKNLKFDLKSRNLWIKSAKWMFNGKMERTLTEAIAIPLNSNIRTIERQTADYLNHRKLGYGFELNGKLTSVSVADLFLTPESVKANLLFSGKLAVDISEDALK